MLHSGKILKNARGSGSKAEDIGISLEQRCSESAI